MGSYLSAPMLVFRPSVLPRTCETPCGEGPDGPLHSRAPRALLFLPLPVRLSAPATTDERYFLFCRISPSRWSCHPSHCIRILLSSLSIFNLLSHISRPGIAALCGRRERRGGGGGGREDNTNMETYVGILRERRYPEQFFIYSHLKTCIESVT